MYTRPYRIYHTLVHLCVMLYLFFFFFSSRRRHTRCLSDWSSDVCSSDLEASGLYVFDIYFPSVSSTAAFNYSNITATANPDSTNWSTTVFPPSAPNLGGIYDATRK